MNIRLDNLLYSLQNEVSEGGGYFYLFIIPMTDDCSDLSLLVFSHPGENKHRCEIQILEPYNYPSVWRGGGRGLLGVLKLICGLALR